MEQENLHKLKQLFDQVRDELKKLGFPLPVLSFSGPKLEKATEKQLREAIRWLTLYKDGYIPIYYKAKKLVPEKVWEFYAATGVEGTYEQRELSSAYRILKTEWKNRPSVLKKVKDSNKKKRHT